MHDPMTVAFRINYPWPWKSRPMMGRPSLITIWHRDPQRRRPYGARSDDSCDWFGSHRHLSKREQAICKAVWNMQTVIENKEVYGTPLYPDIDDPGPVGRPWVELNEAIREWQRRPRRLHPRWHVWHWQIQVHPLQKLKRWLFSRCAVCHGRFAWGEAPISGCWDGSGPRWLRSEPRVWHEGCQRQDGEPSIGLGGSSERGSGWSEQRRGA